MLLLSQSFWHLEQSMHERSDDSTQSLAAGLAFAVGEVARRQLHVRIQVVSMFEPPFPRFVAPLLPTLGLSPRTARLPAGQDKALFRPGGGNVEQTTALRQLLHQLDLSQLLEEARRVRLARPPRVTH